MDAGAQQILLKHLFEHGVSTEDGLEDALGDVDQIGPKEIAEWADEAGEQGLIEPVDESQERRRWQITDAGRRAIGDKPRRKRSD